MISLEFSPRCFHAKEKWLSMTDACSAKIKMPRSDLARCQDASRTPQSQNHARALQILTTAIALLIVIVRT